MKRILFVLALSILFVAPAFAQYYGPQPEPVIREVGHWVWADGAWQDDPAAYPEWYDARCYASTKAAGDCNKKDWKIPVWIMASVCGWLDWELDGTRWDWFIRKPGCYAANCIKATIASNTDVEIIYSEFNDLESVLGNNHKNTIPVWYSWGNGVTINMIEGGANGGWQTPAELMAEPDLLDESELTGDYDLHDGLVFKLYNKICVERCNTACEYFDDALITISLREQKPWIEFETGEYQKDLGTYIKWGNSQTP